VAQCRPILDTALWASNSFISRATQGSQCLPVWREADRSVLLLPAAGIRVRIVIFCFGKQLPDTVNHEAAQSERRAIDFRHDAFTTVDDSGEVFQVVTAIIIVITAIEERGILCREKCHGQIIRNSECATTCIVDVASASVNQAVFSPRFAPSVGMMSTVTPPRVQRHFGAPCQRVNACENTVAPR
jgi:hypothetical protein